MTDLINLLKPVPALALALAVLSTLIYVVEKFLALSGPMSKLVRWWHGRELARIRREAEVRAERRRIAHEEESAILIDLREQVADLTREVVRLRGVVRSSEAHHRVVREWSEGLLRAARTAGLQYVDPPDTDELPLIPSPAPAPA